MAVFGNRIFKYFQFYQKLTKCILERKKDPTSVKRTNFTASYLSRRTQHGEEYEYEITSDPKEWQFVERLMPQKIVPSYTIKGSYPSGWRPPTADINAYPYFVERSKNHMLSVYLRCFDRGFRKETLVKNIHGDIFKLHDELKDHLEKEEGKLVASCVHEGNRTISFKGDHVYYVEQWMLGKGF